MGLMHRRQRDDEPSEARPTSDVGAELVHFAAFDDDDAAPEISKRERGRQLARLAAALGSSARQAGAGAVTSGRWLTDLLVETAPRIPVRDRETLRAHHPGLSDDAIADLLIRGAARATAAVGAGGGALAAASWTLPATLVVSVPVQLAAESLAVATIETKLVAELHALHGIVLAGSSSQRAVAYVSSWASGRGLDPTDARMLTTVMGTAAKARIRRRLLGRATRGLTSLGPLFSGAVAGAIVNSRATTSLGTSMSKQLRGRVVPGEIIQD